MQVLPVYPDSPDFTAHHRYIRASLTPDEMAGSGWTAAYVLSLIGGILIILGAMGILAVGGSIGTPFGLPDYSYLVCGILGILLGIVTIVGAAIAFQRPNTGIVWGSLIIVFSILSWVVALGGMILGSILAFVGGLLFLAVKPEKKMSVQPIYGTYLYAPSQQHVYTAVEPNASPIAASKEDSSPAVKLEHASVLLDAIRESECSQCGQTVEADLRFCPHCGFRIN